MISVFPPDDQYFKLGISTIKGASDRISINYLVINLSLTNLKKIIINEERIFLEEMSKNILIIVSDNLTPLALFFEGKYSCIKAIWHKKEATANIIDLFSTTKVMRNSCVHNYSPIIISPSEYNALKLTLKGYEVAYIAKIKNANIKTIYNARSNALKKLKIKNHRALFL